MTSPETKINLFKTKMLSATAFETYIYEEAISMVENNVNTDKVQNWVNNVLFCYEQKPKPLSANQEKANADKKAHSQERNKMFDSINNRMKTLLEEYGVVCIGFFDWKQFTKKAYEHLEKTVALRGYNICDYGDGAYELIVSKKPIDENFKVIVNEIKNELEDFSKKSVLDSYTFYEVDDFNDKLGTIFN